MKTWSLASAFLDAALNLWEGDIKAGLGERVGVAVVMNTQGWYAQFRQLPRYFQKVEGS